MNRTRMARAAAVLLGVSLVATACGSSKAAVTTKTPTSSGATTSAGGAATAAGTTASTSATPATTTAAATGGGTLTVGAEQEPDCLDRMGSCGGSSWGYWMANVNTLPRAFDTILKDGVWTPMPSALLTSEPTVVSSPKQVVTYKLNPKAVWSTGDPVTSSDFKYTWDQVVNGKDIYDTSGFNKIESVDDSKPDTAVVTYKEPYAGWKQLFGGSYGIYPSKALTGKDRNAEMKDGYAFSAGPYKIDKWEKGVAITLVKNDKWWGDTKPNLDKIVFKFVADTAAEFQAYKAGEVDMIKPQPQIAVVDAIKAGIEGNSAYSANTGSVEGLWLNNSKAPFETPEVRQALAYAIDRDAIVNRLFGPLGVTKAVQSFNPPILAAFAGTDFGVYKKDLAKVTELMTKAGFAKGGDGIWAKGGAKATFALRTTAGNKRRELTQEVLIAQLKEAGFEMTTDNVKAGDLFGKLLPAGDFQAALYAQVATFVDPSLSNLFQSDNIPSEANKNSGQNWTRTNIPAADPLLKQIDSEIDTAKRIAASKAADKLIADSATSIPLDPLPNILLWAKKVTGPVSDNPVLGPWWNLGSVGVGK